MLSKVIGNCSRAVLRDARAFSTISTKSGHLYVWGKTDNNVLGMNLSKEMFSVKDVVRSPRLSVPTLNPSLTNVTQVVATATKSFAVTSDGSVYAWGQCPRLSLGLGPEETSVHYPTKIRTLDGIKIVKVAAGENTGAALSDEGELFTWGWGGSFWSGNSGLGHGNNVSQPFPALVEYFYDLDIRIADIAVGNSHMAAIDSNGVVYTWGSGEHGRCGNGKSSQKLPEVVELLKDEKFVSIAAGTAHTLALTADNRLFGWGKNDASQLGLGANIVMDLNTMEEFPTPIELEQSMDGFFRFNGRVSSIACGANHSVVTTTDGSAWEFGSRTFITPTPIYSAWEHAPEPDSKDSLKEKEKKHVIRAVQAVAGESVSGFIDADGKLYTWGAQRHSAALGRKAEFLGVKQFEKVEALDGKIVFSAQLGSQHGLAAVQEVQK